MLINHRVSRHLGLLAHTSFNVAALTVDAVQRACQLVGPACIVGQQAFNAQGHVAQAPGSIDARSQRKAEIKGGGDVGFAARCCEQAGQPRLQVTRADALEALCYQAAVVGIQLHDIGHCAQCNEW